MQVTTWTLESRTAPSGDPSGEPAAWPAGTRLERADPPTPELARFLYALVGGPWRWTDRIAWSRRQWEAELAVPGTELHVLYAAGSPQGYVELQPTAPGEVEVRYLGLVAAAAGRGWGRLLLEHGLHLAWSLGERHDLSTTERVWVHTCSLDGPAALANYRARGLSVVSEVVTEEDVPAEPVGSWTATTGLDA